MRELTREFLRLDAARDDLFEAAFRRRWSTDVRILLDTMWETVYTVDLTDLE